MRYRRLGSSGLKVSELSLGTATFGGRGEFFQVWGSTDVEEARRLVDISLAAGVNLIDTANVYSAGLAEEILGAVIAGRRDEILVASKVTSRMDEGINSHGSSRLLILREVEATLRRLGTDYLDILFMHQFDGTTPVEEVLSTLETLVASGKVRYLGASNFSGWQLMKSLAVSDRYGWARYATHQVHYSLAAREYELEHAPLDADQGVGAMVWSPLSGGALAGRIRRGQDVPMNSRVAQQEPTAPLELLYDIVDVLDAIAAETERSISQVALNWVLRHPTVSSVVMGVRTEQQLLDNLGAVGWELTADQVARLDAASHRPAPWPYANQQFFRELAPSSWLGWSI